MFRGCSLLVLLVVIAPLAIAQDGRPSLMVLPFALDDSQGSRNWVAQAFQESLSAATGRNQLAVVVAAPERLVPPQEQRDALAVARDNHVDLVLFGACKLDGQAIRVSAQLCDVATGKEIGSLLATGSIRDIVGLQDDVYRRLRELVLNAPAIVADTPAPIPATAPVQPAVAEPDPQLSYQPTYGYYGSNLAATGYAYYPAYTPDYVYDPGYIYTPPFLGLYFGYCGGWYDRDNYGHRGHHGWGPYDARQARHDGVTTLKYSSAVHSTPSHVDFVRNGSQRDTQQFSRESSTFRASDSPQPGKTARPGVREDAAGSVAGPVYSPSAERDMPRSTREVQRSASRDESDAPRFSPAPVSRAPSVSRDTSDSPRVASPPPPAPAPRAPVLSPPSRGVSSGRR